MEPPLEQILAGGDLSSPLDAVFVNAPLRDHSLRKRVNNITLPVLDMGYITSYAAQQGFNVAVLDAEALGLTVEQTQHLLNSCQPGWVGLNLLAPTYELSARIVAGLREDIAVMVGGHQAKAMPHAVLADPRFARVDALVLGEGETRVAELLNDPGRRAGLPGIMWVDPAHGKPVTAGDTCPDTEREHYLAPDLNALPFLDRGFLINDPFPTPDGRIEANMVGTRGCPYNCSFCGAAVSLNKDISIRVRSPENLLAEMHALQQAFGVTAFRFVDDLFLGRPSFIHACMDAFAAEGIGDRYVWDATGRINVLYQAKDRLLDRLAENGCREIALGMESGSARLLRYMNKGVTPAMTRTVMKRLPARGISVKGYFILGFPTETHAELHETIDFIHRLWELTDTQLGQFRASVFEFRPYPGTPEWHRFIATGNYTPAQLLAYTPIDLTHNGLDDAMRARDEFNFSVNLQFGEVSITTLCHELVQLSRAQYARNQKA